MKHIVRCALCCALLVLSAAAAAESDADASAPGGFEEAIAGLTLTRGFIDVYSDEAAGRVLALLPTAAAEGDGTLLRFIHAVRLTRGLGSNPLGLDRGWGNAGRIVRFRRIGERVVAEVENHRYRAATENGLEREAVAASFATSFIWATEVVAENDDGRALIDLAGFLASDQLGLGKRLSDDDGPYALQSDRSFPDASSLLVFPDNVEIDAWLTFSGEEPGREIRATAADAGHVTLIQHHSFVRLPDDGYRTRRADPRTGTFSLGFYDYAAPLDRPIVSGLAMRHRLQYNEPGRPDSGIREPLVFHIDSGAPGPIRQALVDGASWWAEAFEAAGFAGGYRVEILPAQAHPLDIRYNVVQWVHRQTRGWSYGGGIIDPRTGEMIKGHVILGSQRVRQDRMIFEGLAGVDAVGSGSDDDPVELALDRIRQLAAHELGHALGFGHNFAASADDRASVMDYPAPWVQVRNDRLDFSRAYDTGIGEWDKLTARWLYSEFPPDVDESARLDAIVAAGVESGLRFVTDQHARSVSTAHPEGAVWDNGNDAIEELEQAMAVRNLALSNFGPDRIRTGRPLAELREVLVPIYLYHRYQVDAAAKSLGGIRFSYARRGGPGATPEPVAPERQYRALEMLVKTLEPAFLDPPARLDSLMPPAYDGYWFDRRAETLPSRTNPAFDPFTAAETAADVTFAALLDSRRAERLVRQAALDPDFPSLGTVIDALAERLGERLQSSESQRRRAIMQRVVERFAASLMVLESESASAQVQSIARSRLAALGQRLERTSRADRAYAEWLGRRIERHLAREAPPREPVAAGPEIPPGSPIGASVGLEPWVAESCWHCR